MDQLTYTRLSLLSCTVVFYYYYHKLLSWYLDQVPPVPKLTEPFEEIIEIPRHDIHPYPIIEPVGMVMGGFPSISTIVVEGALPGPLHHLTDRILGPLSLYYSSPQ